MKRCLSPVVGPVFAVLLIPALSGVAQPPGDEATLGRELRVGETYHVLPIGEDYSHEGTPVEVVAIDKEWIKFETGLLEARYVRINLRHVGASKTTERVEVGRPPE
jgi:hypothetical protein